MNQYAVQVIEALGGTAEVARMCKVRMPSVSDWKRDGIPAARMMFLSAVHAQTLQGIDIEAATATKRSVVQDDKAATDV